MASAPAPVPPPAPELLPDEVPISIITDDETQTCKNAFARANDAWEASRTCAQDADCEKPYGDCASARGGRPREELEQSVLAAVTACHAVLGVTICDDETRPVCSEHRCRVLVVNRARHLESHDAVVDVKYVIHARTDVDAFLEAKPKDFADAVVREKTPTSVIVVADVQLRIGPLRGGRPPKFVTVFDLADGTKVEKPWFAPDPERTGWHRVVFGLAADVVRAQTVVVH